MRISFRRSFIFCCRSRRLRQTTPKGPDVKRSFLEPCAFGNVEQGYCQYSCNMHQLLWAIVIKFQLTKLNNPTQLNSPNSGSQERFIFTHDPSWNITMATRTHNNLPPNRSASRFKYAFTIHLTVLVEQWDGSQRACADRMCRDMVNEFEIWKFCAKEKVGKKTADRLLSIIKRCDLVTEDNYAETIRELEMLITDCSRIKISDLEYYLWTQDNDKQEVKVYLRSMVQTVEDILTDLGLKNLQYLWSLVVIFNSSSVHL